MTTSREMIHRIDAALAATSDPGVSADAVRWQPSPSVAHRFPALFIPAAQADRVCLVDLGEDASASSRRLIGCDLLEKVTVEGAGDVSTDLLFDEEGSPLCRDDAVFNVRATRLVHALKLGQALGEYPAPAAVEPRDLVREAALWFRNVRLFGPVVVLGADERTGAWVPVPDRLLEFVSEKSALGLKPDHDPASDA